MSTSYLITATPGTTRPDFARLKRTLEDIVRPQYTRYATEDDIDPVGAVEVVCDTFFNMTLRVSFPRTHDAFAIDTIDSLSDIASMTLERMPSTMAKPSDCVAATKLCSTMLSMPTPQKYRKRINLPPVPASLDTLPYELRAHVTGDALATETFVGNALAILSFGNQPLPGICLINRYDARDAIRMAYLKRLHTVSAALQDAASDRVPNEDGHTGLMKLVDALMAHNGRNSTRFA